MNKKWNYHFCPCGEPIHTKDSRAAVEGTGEAVRHSWWGAGGLHRPVDDKYLLSYN